VRVGFIVSRFVGIRPARYNHLGCQPSMIDVGGQGGRVGDCGAEDDREIGRAQSGREGVHVSSHRLPVGRNLIPRCQLGGIHLSMMPTARSAGKCSHRSTLKLRALRVSRLRGSGLLAIVLRRNRAVLILARRSGGLRGRSR
jgi:hypothetical protein